jgi:hypothetical protein
MAQTPDAHAFDVVSTPLGTSTDEFRQIAHAAASVDTLDGFLHDMQARYPDASTISTPSPDAANPAPGARPPETQPAAPSPPARAAGRTAQR